MVNKWLITGGCGFVGTSLIKELLDINPDLSIRVLDNLSVGTKYDLAEVARFKEKKIGDVTGSPKGVELCVGDVRSIEEATLASMGVDCIVHLAANTGVGPSVENPAADMESNVIGTFNMLESARINSVEKFIFASSGAPLGELECPPIHEELAAHPVSPYGASKLAGEGYCSAYFGSYGIDTVALRFGNVYGPRSKNKSSVVAKFIKQAFAGDSCEIYGDGCQTRDFIYISDLVKAIIKAVNADVGGEIFQIASSREVSLNELVQVLKLCLKSHNIDMKLKNVSKRLGDVQRNYSDTRKAKVLLGWHAITSLDDGISKTIEYYLQRNGQADLHEA